MSEKKSLKRKDDSLLNKFINFLNNLFKIKKTENTSANIEVKEESIKSNLQNKIEFADNIKLKQEDSELLKLQKKFENKEIDIKVLTDEQIEQLNDLYSRQIKELENELDKKKKELVNTQYMIQTNK
jgi:hypothetical protein